MLKREFWKLISFICLLYGSFVYFLWKSTGRVQYFFLNFNKGYSAFVNLALINIGATLVYILLSNLDEAKLS
jgi:hypothetical protein